MVCGISITKGAVPLFLRTVRVRTFDAESTRRRLTVEIKNMANSLRDAK
jgi:hypothetical protein